MTKGETIEKQLKDYKGYKIWKITDNHGLKSEKVTYMANLQDGDNANCADTLKGLKDWIDLYKGK